MTERLPVTFDADGLIPVVTSDANSGAVLMVAFMNVDALARTRDTGLVHYWSRSRGRIWLKGETSGHMQHVHQIFVNCDLNSLLIEVEQIDAVCHDGYPTCFYRRLEADNTLTSVRDRWFDPADVYGEDGGIAALTRLWWSAYLELANAVHREHSATSRLLHAAEDHVTSRIADELRELAGALDRSHRHQDVAADVLLEAGQVCYWTVLRCIRDGVSWEDVRPDRALAPLGSDDVAPVPTTATLLRQLADSWTGEVAPDLYQLAHETMASVTRACALAGIKPDAVIRADLAERRSRPYLVDFFAGKDALPAG